MKKVVIVLIAVFVCFESFAQETLKGRWLTSGKAMGMTITQTLVFDAEQSGSVERILTLTSYIPASIHNEAMLSGAWTSIAQ